MIERELLKLLRCPQSGGLLILSPDNKELWCMNSLKAYPIKDNIPVLRLDQARDLELSSL